ncbi:MAG: hypothetical protein Tp1111DCM1126091_37 [Prokaryotic dsDNA virus sp.]|nr:MAG: hypothetical protein Tp1111DCM1126091_37 [Prokaryotic dsDNA virus sp.]|tara:strand:+ start:84565 stop:84978 length:414 start_codon:yes stop_codon:yes gene_type:complete
MRISKGKPVFGRKDTVDFRTLSEIILAWLVKFRDDYDKLGIYSVPVDIAEAHPENSSEKWLEIIDKMIYAFADIEPEYSGEITIHTDRIENSGYRRLTTEVSDQDAWERYREESLEHQQKVEEGLMLFGEYFRSLWV